MCVRTIKREQEYFRRQRERVCVWWLLSMRKNVIGCFGPRDVREIVWEQLMVKKFSIRGCGREPNFGNFKERISANNGHCRSCIIRF